MIRWLTRDRSRDVHRTPLVADVARDQIPPRPPEYRRPESVPPLALAAAWMTLEPLRPEFDPCGAGPMARASSKSGESR
jgi:hypothetical protein